MAIEKDRVGYVGERNKEYDSRREKKHGDPRKSTGSVAHPLWGGWKQMRGCRYDFPGAHAEDWRVAAWELQTTYAEARWSTECEAAVLGNSEEWWAFRLATNCSHRSRKSLKLEGEFSGNLGSAAEVRDRADEQQALWQHDVLGFCPPATMSITGMSMWMYGEPTFAGWI